MQKDVTGDSQLRLWLDAQGRPLQLITSGSYAGKPDLVTVTYTDWGAAPTVAAPSADRRHYAIRVIRVAVRPSHRYAR